uniref:Uncharacterized protein n=1 Tax=Serinus canaria TaxID=9135 RepID=A0A8C9UFN7_SERCA
MADAISPAPLPRFHYLSSQMAMAFLLHRASLCSHPAPPLALLGGTATQHSPAQPLPTFPSPWKHRACAVKEQFSSISLALAGTDLMELGNDGATMCDLMLKTALHLVYLFGKLISRTLENKTRT